MTQEERDALRRKVYNEVRNSYPDPDFFPESYEEARSDSGVRTGDGLAHFIAVEVWEVMEGQETLEGCREEAARALSNAREDLRRTTDALEEYR